MIIRCQVARSTAFPRLVTNVTIRRYLNGTVPITGAPSVPVFPRNASRGRIVLVSVNLTIETPIASAVNYILTSFLLLNPDFFGSWSAKVNKWQFYNGGRHCKNTLQNTARAPLILIYKHNTLSHCNEVGTPSDVNCQKCQTSWLSHFSRHNFKSEKHKNCVAASR